MVLTLLEFGICCRRKNFDLEEFTYFTMMKKETLSVYAKY